MKAYIYQASMYCDFCGSKLCRELPKPIEHVEDDEYSYDSDEYPKGPYSDGGGEADCPQHCADCGEFLQNPLTGDGYKYVADAITSYRNAGSQPFLCEWAEYYRNQNDTLDEAIERSTIDFANA